MSRRSPAVGRFDSCAAPLLAVGGTLIGVDSLVVLPAAFALIGVLRPRWSSLYTIAVPAALPLVWVIWGAIEPTRSLNLSASWYLTVSAGYGGLAAAGCVVGIAAARGVSKLRSAQAG